MDETPNKANDARTHVAMMGRVTAWGGWVLALGSLFLGHYLLNKLHMEIVEMQRENKELQVNLAESRERLQKHLDQKAEEKTLAEEKKAARRKR